MLDGDLSNDRSGMLLPVLPATRCTYLTHIKTGFLRIDPPEPVFDDGVAASFDVSLSQYFPGYSDTEVCLTPASRLPRPCIILRARTRPALARALW